MADTSTLHAITILAKAFVFDKSTGTYSIKLTDTKLLSHNKKKKTITFQMSPKHIHKNCQTMQINNLTEIIDDAQMDYLLDEIEMEKNHTRTQHPGQHSSQSSTHYTILSEIISEWNTNFNNKYHIQICEGDHKCKDCESIKRIQFILHYYSQWMAAKGVSPDESTQSSPSISSTPLPGQVSHSKLMSHFTFMSDFFYELTNYSSYDLSNDFTHLLRYHIFAGLEAKTDTIKYFESSLKSCNVLDCQCYKRHKRDLGADNMNFDAMKQHYFICNDDLMPGKGNGTGKTIEFKMNKEINLQHVLDKIHVCLLHEKHSIFISNSFKYISRLKSNENTNDIMLEKYTFGSSITYWDAKHHRYCAPKYSDLRSELLGNHIYSLSVQMYENLKLRAMHFLNTKYGKSLVALREHDWMKKFKILYGAQISLDHVIALYCYCNISALQRAYRGQGQDQQSSIWHYSRLLLECVHCYGSPMDKRSKYYHGIDNKLIFDRYNIMIDIPVSVSRDKKIAYSFSEVKDGISVELSHGGLSDLQSLCFDLSYLSDNPLEEEHLIYHTFISVKDIVVKRLHHDQWLKILRFWHKVNEGFFCKHLIASGQISRNDQLCICAMISNLMNEKTNFKNKKYDTRIPKYMQKLFNVLGGNGFLWIIQGEYDLFIPKLKKYLLDSASPFIAYLSKYKYITVRYAQIFNWFVNSIDINQLFLNTRPWIKSDKYKIFLNDSSDYLLFHFEAQNKAKSNLFRIKLIMDYKPPYVSSISFGNGLFIEKLQFDNYSYGELTQHKSFNMSLHSLFKTDLLKEKDIQNGFNLKLQIQLFSIKNKNGELININPHQ